MPHNRFDLPPNAKPAVAPTSGDPTLVALTVEEAARRLGIGRTTMYALIAAGDVPSITIGRLRRVPAEALGAYVAGLLVADLPLAA